jgi:glycosyltransferase involved in cell wall biosynthesis
MIVLHAVHDLAAKSGGPSRSVPLLCRQLVIAGIEVRLAVATTESPETAEARSLEGARRLVLAERGRLWPSRDLRRAAAAASIVHVHGAWLPFNHGAAAAARGATAPLVISPRGMLEPWSLGHHRWRKRIAWLAYQRRDLASAALVHATAGAEAEHLRSLGVTAPIAVIPNGVDLPGGDGSLARVRRFLYLSRLHPKKGAALLIKAIASHATRMRSESWTCLIAGPDEDGHGAELRALVASLRLEDLVAFSGEVAGDEKLALFRKSAVFVLPSHSENFGLVVAEALASGTPAIATTGTPWRELEERCCGWWVEPTIDGISEALSAALDADSATLRSMGERGRELVAERYGWEAAGEAMAAAYRWILDGGPQPPCVQLRR